MKNETKNLVKIINETAENRTISVDNTLTQLVEMSYQFAVTGTYSRNYSFMQNEHNEFIACLMEAMKKRPYFDYFAEIMVELGSFDQKFKAQCMTPPEITRVVYQMLGDKKSKLGEPTCGTGSFVLEMLKGHVSRENKNNRLELKINDIDNRLVKIAVTQCLLNLVVNNTEDLQTMHLTAWNNNLITEYKKNGYIVYDNNPNKIQEPYIMRFVEHKREEEAINDMHRRMLNSLSAESQNADQVA